VLLALPALGGLAACWHTASRTRRQAAVILARRVLRASPEVERMSASLRPMMDAASFDPASNHVAEVAPRLALDVGPVERTMLIPLWARAEETRKRHPLVRDPRSLQICESLDYDFGTFRRAYGTQAGCVLRGLLYDRWVGDFLARHPSGTVVELGAGLSTRFERLDNGRACWVDVDLPHAMTLRTRLFPASPRRTFLSASVLDADWPSAVQAAAAGPYYFVCEGMLMYLEPDEVRSFFTRSADAFGGSELVFDSIAPIVVRYQTLHDSMKHMMDAPFRWGIDDVRRIERWDRRLAVRDVATLPEIARRFRGRLGLPHRLIAALAERTLPAFASAYRLARVELGA
jgi:O-methyltransferase involved in polyketide biosynthesis